MKKVKVIGYKHGNKLSKICQGDSTSHRIWLMNNNRWRK